jgi:hypothetical protein
MDVGSAINSMPNFLITSARKSRFACEVSTSSTRFFLTPLGMGAESSGAGGSVVFMPTPSVAARGMKFPLAWLTLLCAQLVSWARFRRVMFCLRWRLNLDLSPFRADIMISCDSAVSAG